MLLLKHQVYVAAHLMCETAQKELGAPMLEASLHYWRLKRDGHISSGVHPDQEISETLSQKKEKKQEKYGERESERKRERRKGRGG